MALSPVRAFAFATLWAFWVSLVSSAVYEPEDLPECEGWDILLGCNSWASQLVSRFLLGTIPGVDVPFQVNVFFAILGLIVRISGAWSIMELIRGT